MKSSLKYRSTVFNSLFGGLKIILVLCLVLPQIVAASELSFKWRNPGEDGYHGIYSNVIIGHDGTLYASMDNFLYAMDSNGNELWSVDVDDLYSDDFEFLSVLNDGNIIASSEKGVELFAAKDGEYIKNGGQFAFPQAYLQKVTHLQNGELVMAGRVYSPDLTSFEQLHESEEVFDAAVASDGTIYLTVGLKDQNFAPDTTVIAFNKDLSLRWSQTIGKGQTICPAIINDNGRVYAALQRGLYSLAADGSLDWSIYESSKIDSCPTLGINGEVYFVSEGVVYAIGTNGDTLWQYDSGLNTDYLIRWHYFAEASVAVADNSRLYVSVGDNVLVLSSQGQLLEQYTPAEEGLNVVFRNGMIASDGTYYVNSSAGLFAFATSANGPADTPWPMDGVNENFNLRQASDPNLVVQKIPFDNGLPQGMSISSSGYGNWSIQKQQNSDNYYLKSPDIPFGESHTSVSVAFETSSDYMCAQLWVRQRYSSDFAKQKSCVKTEQGQAVATWTDDGGEGSVVAVDNITYMSEANNFSKSDSDDDGVLDDFDEFPLDPLEFADADGDGIGNNADPDDDNDGATDSEDAFPIDETEQLDLDGDGFGHNSDSDDDNDGVEDSQDAFPLDPEEWLDNDNDGIGNNADQDDDNDSVLDEEDEFPFDSSAHRSGRIKWIYDAGAEIITSPALYNGLIIFANGDGRIIALNKSGELVWEFQADDVVLSSPSVGPDGSIYFGSQDKKLYALTTDGKLKWTFESDLGAIWTSPAISPDGTIYVVLAGVVVNSGGKLVSLTPEGKVNWNIVVPGLGNTAPAINANGDIYVTTDKGTIHRFNVHGEEIWERSIIGNQLPLSSPVIGRFNWLFISSPVGNVVSVAENGNRLWAREFENQFVFLEAPPVVDGEGNLYLTSDRAYTSFTRFGRTRFNIPHGTGTSLIERSSLVIGEGNILYSGEVALTARNFDGELLWEERDARFLFSPTLDDDGTLYGGNSSGELFAIQTDSKGLADTPWPKANRDLANSNSAIAAKQRGQIIVPADMDGDGKSDFLLRDPIAFQNYSRALLNDEITRTFYGQRQGDIPLVGDFDGDGIGDLTIRRPSKGMFYYKRSTDGVVVGVGFGREKTDIPVLADYDGDGITDIAIRRLSNKTWYIRQSTTGKTVTLGFGLRDDDIPVPADYDGDGKADIAIRRVTDKTWYIKRSSDGTMMKKRFGIKEHDIAVPADYDGDRIVDIAIRRPTNGTWYILRSSDGETEAIEFGTEFNDIPVVGDYDGDGKADLALRRTATFEWLIKDSYDGQEHVREFGRNTRLIPTLMPMQSVMELVPKAD